MRSIIRAIPKSIALLFVCVIAASLIACTPLLKARKLSAGITSQRHSVEDDLDTQNAKMTDFAVRLFKASVYEDDNLLLSPLSLVYALGMCANGASATTLEQIETTLGMSTDEINSYMYSYMKALPADSKKQLKLANSLWFAEGDGLSIKKDFLQTNADYYGADIYQTVFGSQALADINTWVNDQTDGMIPKILDELSDKDVMYLINALAFDAPWDEPYENTQVRDGSFLTEDGLERDVRFMYSSEQTYLEDAHADGFIKPYKDGEYAFVALLPREGLSVLDYVNMLDGTSLQKMLTNAQNVEVAVAIPQFESADTKELSEVLQGMGITDAFSPSEADFKRITSSYDANLFISMVLQKTFISVDEKGTKAAAATVVGVIEGASPAPAQMQKEVYLDRPFVYMIVDTKNMIPLFMGTVMDV